MRLRKAFIEVSDIVGLSDIVVGPQLGFMLAPAAAPSGVAPAAVALGFMFVCHAHKLRRRYESRC